ncbi:MAG: acetolactate synthase large subunit [Pseudomonadota bacterium]
MNGAESLVETFLANGLDVCFANPGTSEMHFVAALDSHPDMRCVLCLFEGGASGAADGYWRMSGKVSATMFHLAPGFGNAYANLHNARKAGAGIVNVMGDHASYHLAHESPLKGDTEGVSLAVSHWTRTAMDAGHVGLDGRDAVAAARSRNGQIATLILPADAAWGEGALPESLAQTAPLHRASDAETEAALSALSGSNTALYVGGAASHGPLLEQAGQIATARGCRLIAPLFVSRLERGAGAVATEQLPYEGAGAAEMLDGLDTLVCVGAPPPVNFFAYPGRPSLPTPPRCRVIELCRPEMDVAHAIDALAEQAGAQSHEPARRPLDLPPKPNEGALTAEAACALISRWLPESAIVVNESITSGRTFSAQSASARRHDLLITMGGAIGGGLPLAVGAAIACPERPVVAMVGDGSAMYTIQSLWTMAREALDVTTIVFANRTYQILHYELEAMGAGAAGRNAQRMFDLTQPELDFVALAKGHGIAAERAETTSAFAEALERARQTPGPTFIEVVL